jgi:predicted phage terminase large subunit-like protein
MSAAMERQLLEEANQRRECRRSFFSWCLAALKPYGQKPAAHHRLIIDELQAVADGKVNRLMLFCPPGSAKSFYATRLFSAWQLARRPNMKLIGACHTSELADDFSGKIHDIINENRLTLGYSLRSNAKGRWSTTNGGEYLAAGVRTGLPGFRADSVVIDDPVKGRQAADSEADRKLVWDWYNGDLERRLTPGASIVLMMTRWHEADLAGMLLETEPDRWRVLTLRAEAEDGDDPLGRAPGELLWSDDAYGYGAELAGIKASLEARGATREWAAQYQQRPRPQEGALFKPAFITVLDACPPVVAQVRAWDLAATAKTGTRDPDWTVGVRLGRLPDARYIVMDVVRARGGPADVLQLIKATATQDGKAVPIDLPIDPGQAGKAQTQWIIGQLAGYTVRASPETGDKATRASPVASQCNVGNLLMVRGQWNKAFIDELGSFPAGSKDDQVDSLARAFSHVALTPPTPIVGAIVAMTPRNLGP